METLDFTGLLFEILPLKNLLDFTMTWMLMMKKSEFAINYVEPFKKRT